ncbi:MAG TPA: VWA-like domain-containing protein [Campylobacterales bacterium]|nr:VWA-like domain-containing protein [Campylobacterales bacterium]
MQTEEIFSKLRVEFLFEHPFLSVLALSLPTHFVGGDEEKGGSLFSTNGREIFINETLIGSYENPQIKYLYVHTLLHVILKHAFRVESREKNIWNLASDIAINLLLEDFKNIGVRPEKQPFDPRYKNKCVEEIYESLYEENRVSPLLFEESDDLMESSGDSELDMDEFESELDALIIQALNIAKNSGALPSGFYREIDGALEVKIDIKELLGEFLTLSFFEKTSSFREPNRRYIHKGLYLPAHSKTKERIRLYIALDMSSSIELDEYRKFLGIVGEISDNFYEYDAKVIPFDSEVKEELIFEFDGFSPLDKERLRVPKSDGGTNINAVFDYIDKTENIYERGVLLVLSDGFFEVSRPIKIETLFLLTEKKNLLRHEPHGRVAYYDKRA